MHSMDDLLLILQPVETFYHLMSDQELTDLSALHEAIAQNDAVYAQIPGAWYMQQKLIAETRYRANKHLTAPLPRFANAPTGLGSSRDLARRGGDTIFNHWCEFGKGRSYVYD